MTRLLLLPFLLFLVQPVATFGQCNQYYVFDEGSEWVLETYNAKDKRTGTMSQKVLSFQKNGDGFDAVITSTITDEKGKEVNTGELGFKCEDGIVSIDMRNFLNEEQLKMFENYEVEVEGTNLEVPNDLSVGQTLRDGTMTITTKGSPLPMKMTINITDRKVVGQESITTPAGTFNCYKISSNSMMQSKIGIGMTVNYSGIEWLAPEVGVVRSESFNKNGKLQGYTLLVSRK